MRSQIEGFYPAWLELAEAGAWSGQGTSEARIAFTAEPPDDMAARRSYAAHLIALADFGEYVKGAKGPESNRSLAARCELPLRTVDHILRGEWPPKFAPVQSLYTGLGGRAFYMAFFHPVELAMLDAANALLLDPTDHPKAAGALFREQRLELGRKHEEVGRDLGVDRRAVVEFESARKTSKPVTVEEYFRGLKTGIAVAFCGIRAEQA